MTGIDKIRRGVKLHLVDVDFRLVGCWEKAFADAQEVEILCNDILQVAHTCVVSPANSHGFMDGGIDEDYSRYFGPGIQATVQRAIARRPEGMLPVGASLLVRTAHVRIPYLIVAPTMEMPGAVPPSRCYHSMVAVLRVAHQNAERVADVFCPGMATGTGRVEPEFAAREMAAAYRDWTARMRAG